MKTKQKADNCREIVEIVTIEKKNRGKFIPDKAIELRDKGLNYTEIAKYLGISKQAVSAGFRSLDLPTKEELADFQANRANYLEMHMMRLLQALSHEDIKKMNGRDKIISSGVLYDKLRLEKGLSTQNQAVTVLTDAIRQASKN